MSTSTENTTSPSTMTSSTKLQDDLNSIPLADDDPQGKKK